MHAWRGHWAGQGEATADLRQATVQREGGQHLAHSALGVGLQGWAGRAGRVSSACRPAAVPHSSPRSLHSSVAPARARAVPLAPSGPT